MMRIARKPEKDADAPVTTLFAEGDVPGGRASFGIAVLPPGDRIPASGVSVHADCDEYSYVVKGTALVHVQGETVRLHPGDGLLIPAGAAHWALNDGEEPLEVVWALVQRGR